MTIACKETVRFRRILPEIYGIFGVLDEVFESHGVECVITSANDSTHMNGSLHYQDRAIDLRSRDLRPGEEEQVAEELRYILGADYQVLFEDQDTPNEHLHVAWKPKENP